MRVNPVDLSSDDAVRKVLESSSLGPLAPRTLLGVLAHRPRLMARVAALGNALEEGGALTERQRALVALRVAIRTRCDYAWSLHVSRSAARCGIESPQLQALQHLPASASCWNEAERALIEAADELHKGATLSAATWDAMARHWSQAERVEILVWIGYGYLQAFVANGAGIAPEPGTENTTAGSQDGG